jgi:succinyl-CoA synthetase beta subunit
MNIHEYQAKELLRSYGAPLLRGQAATSAEGAMAVARQIGGISWVVKAQIHAGGRGKAGGVKLARTVEEVGGFARQMLGKVLTTSQTGPRGRIVHRVYVEDTTAVARELYLSLLIDRTTSRIAFLASGEGGVDIEKAAHKDRRKIATFRIDPASGYMPYMGGKVAAALGLKEYAARQCRELCKSMYDAFVAKDMSLLEINPLVLTPDGELFVLDAKATFDDNALYRHTDIQALRDFEEEDPKETEAAKYGLSYVKLDGTIGCMVNGAGLAMATLDIIKLTGGMPANFLDVGGGANAKQVAAAFKIILSDPAVKGILVNIFGGIMKCNIIAEGIVAAAAEVQPKVPLVVRLAGTNAREGKAILAESALAIIAADDLADAAEKIVTAVKGAA